MNNGFTIIDDGLIEETKDIYQKEIVALLIREAIHQNSNTPQVQQSFLAKKTNTNIKTILKKVKELEESGFFTKKAVYKRYKDNTTQFNLTDKVLKYLNKTTANLENNSLTNESVINEEIDANSDFNLKEESQYIIEAETKQIEKATIKPSMEIENHINISEILDDDFTFNLDLDLEPKETEQTQEEQAAIIVDLPYNESNKIDIAKIQNTIVNYYQNARDNNNGQTRRIFDGIVSTYPSINYLRGNLHQWSKEMKQQYKASNIPLVSVSVLFNEQEKQRTKSNIKQYTNIIAIDIDKQDNETDMEIIRNRVCKMPFVFYCAKSVSGEGLFALVYLDGTLEQFEAHFLSLESYFKSKGIIIDKACKDATRLRYCTNDEDLFINPNACIYSGLKYKTLSIEIKNNKNFNTKQTFSEYQTIYNCKVDEEAEKKLNTIIEDCRNSNIIINPTHKETLLISKAIANDLGENGFNYLLQFAELKHGQNTDIDKYRNLFYNDLNTKTDLHLPSVYKLYKEAKGIEKIKW